MSEILINKESRERKEIPTGFSCTTLLFGLFVPLFRGYFVYFFILLVLCFIGGVGVFIAWFVCPFFINRHYKQHLLNNGWLTERTYDELKEEKDKKERREHEDRMFQQALMSKMLDK
ncbi:hypothetical protein ABKV31_20975 [Enterobacter asburiae]|uniref:hypothetical protein n=1 Tax=Enterobacter asburiae TaxID=61645 RepID=UPI0032AEB2B6